MRIEALRLRHFRNLTAVDLPEIAETIVVRGGNAQGKTNLLEAVYLCATGRSFRHAHPQDLLTYGATEAAVAGSFRRQQVHHQVHIQITPRSRLIRLDDRVLRRPSQLLQLINVVAFFPDDLRLAKGGPEERRRFFDRLVASLFADFVDASLAYHHALRSRNALLKSASSPSRPLLAAFDEQLIVHGEKLHQRRQEALTLTLPLARNYFENIMNGNVSLDIHLLSGVAGEGERDFGQRFRQTLADRLPRDLATRQTTAGPHRADLQLLVGGYDARTFASQGQQRAIVLALKLAELSAVAEKVGAPPILLLDDVSSELDAERNRLLFETIGQRQGQLWITTTGIAPLALQRAAQVVEVHAGRVVSCSTLGGIS
jgi:DNA replication and repair protein RecF